MEAIIGILFVILAVRIAWIQTERNIQKNKTDFWRETALMLQKEINNQKNRVRL